MLKVCEIPFLTKEKNKESIIFSGTVSSFLPIFEESDFISLEIKDEIGEFIISAHSSLFDLNLENHIDKEYEFEGVFTCSEDEECKNVIVFRLKELELSK